jgi:hypothetical protein
VLVSFTLADASARISVLLTEDSDTAKDAFTDRWLASPEVVDVVCREP